VLGQVASSAAASAGEVHKAEELPALTCAASESRVTKGNDWYFRLLRDAAGQGQDLADYARYQYDARELIVFAKEEPRAMNSRPLYATGLNNKRAVCWQISISRQPM